MENIPYGLPDSNIWFFPLPPPLLWITISKSKQKNESIPKTKSLKNSGW